MPPAPYVSYTPTSAGESSQAPSTLSTVTDQQGGYIENRDSAAKNPNPEQADADGQQGSAAQEIPWQSPVGEDSQASQDAASQTAMQQTQPDALLSSLRPPPTPASTSLRRKRHSGSVCALTIRKNMPKTIRQAPTRETPKPKGVKED